MATVRLVLRFEGFETLKNFHRNFNTTSQCFYMPPEWRPPYKPKSSVAGWRIQNGLPASGREYGPLTDTPDWSYADGRPAPLGANYKQRILKQMKYCESILKLTKEIDAAVELTEKLKAEEEQQRLHDMENRLKPKVHAKV